MLIEDTIKKEFGAQLSLIEIEPQIYQIYAPIFHEDGDMLSIYLDTNFNDGTILIRDFGDALRKVGYTFDINSENKKKILSSIANSNNSEIDDGEVLLKATINDLPQAILSYSQLIAKVSSIDILRREQVKSLFYEYLNEEMESKFQEFDFVRSYTPTRDKELTVDYAILKKTPVYIFGVQENTKASKVVITCLSFQANQLPFSSVIIHEDFNSLTSFYRNQITNAADKQFTSLDEFSEKGSAYIKRLLAS